MYETLTDEELLAECIEGVRPAWVAFVSRFTRYVYYLIQVTGRKHCVALSQDDVNDLHNELFLALLEDDRRRLRSFKGENGCSARSWVRIITIRRTIDSLRKRRGHLSLDVSQDDQGPKFQLIDGAETPLERLLSQERNEKKTKLRTLTDTLSQTDRLLLEMVYLRRMSADEIALALNLKKGAVYTRKSRLIQKLHETAKSRGLVDSPD